MLRLWLRDMHIDIGVCVRIWGYVFITHTYLLKHVHVDVNIHRGMCVFRRGCMQCLLPERTLTSVLPANKR